MPDMVVLRNVLQNPEDYSGWLYVKDGPWTLDTQGFFYDQDIDMDPDEEAQLRAGFEQQGWISTLSNEDIEDAVLNTRDQLEEPSDEDLLEAVRFFYDNDAFKVW
jgi:hypothetical protein